MAGMKNFSALLLTCVAITGTSWSQNTTNFPVIGEIHRFDPAFDALIPPDAEIEVISSGFEWSEGPVWIKDEESNGGGYLLFSDIPNNRVMRWEEGVGSSVWMEKSGYTGTADYGREPGCNGLALDSKGRLLFCEHGDRRISVLTKNGGKRTVVDNFEGKRFNSPNDLAIHSSGAIYFTDPIFGLPQRWEDPMRELEFCGVYRVKPDGELTLLVKNLPRPNGIAFSPDEKTLYIANSGETPYWMRYQLEDDGTLGDADVLWDPMKEKKAGLKGGCDGMKVDFQGNLFATGPGGVWVFSSKGKLLGRMQTFERNSNVAWGNDGTVLYITSDMYLCRVKTATKGAGW